MNVTAGDSLIRLCASAYGLLARFRAAPSLKQALSKFNEECDEFKFALNEMLMDGVNEYKAQEAAAELVDVMVTAINAGSCVGVTPAHILAAVEIVIAKNDSKTEATHRLNEDTQCVVRRVVSLSKLDSEKGGL